MLLDFIFAIIGFVLLFYGGEYLVRGSTKLALSFGISMSIVGLTVVAFGTSAPELVVSLLAAVQGSGALSLGNIIGSNIANVGLIIGLTALILPIPIQWGFLKKDMPIMIFASIAYFVFAFSGQINRFHGLFFLMILTVYLYTHIRKMKKERMLKKAEDKERDGTKEKTSQKKEGHLRNVFYVFMGILFLVIGGNLLVKSATGLALSFGISEAAIAISMVAIGTSLPELATSIVAAVRGYPEIVVGNVIGSNIFNVLFVQASVSIIRPVTVQPSLLGFEFPVMVGFALVLFLMMRLGYRVNRIEGGVLLCAYLVVLVMAFLRNPLV